jgi:hypothetical protein
MQLDGHPVRQWTQVPPLYRKGCDGQVPLREVVDLRPDLLDDPDELMPYR